MTATVTAPAATRVAGNQRVPLTRGYRFELVKLLSQWRVRLLILAAWVAPRDRAAALPMLIFQTYP